ncbi:MAG TPA: hypothetical protein VGC54_07015 [Planctomycetota bacterium]
MIAVAPLLSGLLAGLALLPAARADVPAGVATWLQEPVEVDSPTEEAVADPVLQRILERFRQFPAAQQEAMLARIEASVRQHEHLLIRVAKALESDATLAALPVVAPDPQRSYSAEIYAPALGLSTRNAELDGRQSQTVMKHFFAAPVPPFREGAQWQYDAGRRALIAPLERPTPETRLRAFYAGRWPEPGRLQALATAALDDDPGQKTAADYFAHHYRDRDGVVYDGLRLFEIWGSGREFEVSDVEAIAFLREVAGENRLNSPIPASLHKRVYARIEESFRSWRDYSVLREALAARLAGPELPLPPVLASLGRELDQAWAIAGHEPARMRALLAGGDDRKAFFAAVGKAGKRPPLGAEETAAQLAGREGLQAAIASATLDALRDEGLLGLGRRF